MSLIRIALNVEQTAVVHIADSLSTDVFTYKIVLASNGLTFQSGTAIWIAGNDWKVIFTPTSTDTYMLRVSDDDYDTSWDDDYLVDGSVSAIPSFAPAGALSTIDLLNKVLRNCGLSTVSTLDNLDRISTLAFEYLNERLTLVAQGDLWQQLEYSGSITLTEDAKYYPVPDDLVDINKKSFIFDNEGPMPFLTPNEDDNYNYDKALDSGTPKSLHIYAGNFILNRPANEANVGKSIIYRYWFKPPVLATNTPDTVSWFPKGFDESVLVNLATYDLQVYREKRSAQDWWVRVYGGFIGLTEMEGTLRVMQRRFRSKLNSRIKVLGIV